VKDYEDYLSRLHQIPRVLDQATAHMRDGLRDHLDAAEVSARKGIQSGARELPTIRSRRSPFTDPAAEVSRFHPEGDRKRLRAEIEAAVKNEVAPAYAKFAKFVRDDYAPHGRLDPGVWALPDGEARYRFRGASSDDDRFHRRSDSQLGLKSVAEIEIQMLAIAKAQGFSDLKSFNEHIRHDPKLLREVRPAIVRLVHALSRPDVREAAGTIRTAAEEQA
jgi:uncharacterized protein (DUF885 family)